MAQIPYLDPTPEHKRAIEIFIPRAIELGCVREFSNLSLGGGTVLAMHWQHRTSTDLDFHVAEPFSSEWNLARTISELSLLDSEISVNPRGSILIESEDIGRISLVYNEPRDTPMLGKTVLDIACEGPESILYKKIVFRAWETGRVLLRDMYDAAWVAKHRPDMWEELSSRIPDDVFTELAQQCKTILERRGYRQSVGPPLIDPTDRSLTGIPLWQACIDLFDV